MTSSPAPLALSVKEAGQMLGIGHTKIYALVNSGRLRAVKLGSRTLFTEAALREFLATLPAAKTAA